MFEYDICMCFNSKECPNKENCLRAADRGPGIYTSSDFFSIMENNKCDYFLDRRRFNV